MPNDTRVEKAPAGEGDARPSPPGYHQRRSRHPSRGHEPERVATAAHWDGVWARREAYRPYRLAMREWDGPSPSPR
jgi:hypothetical protein